ncbi:SusD-like starch-binding protein associating with outer membrane [Chitinophaga niastensis]|uniref:SusD-like starch-binding protein associating with outer membrane n=1 Tax=Chitinophaga niastensis TaxID=536980 RepID=A0A2P8HLX0_CHINA|nr:SusD/RagB family nutrient-binding outer membrane lipoprotein [Chitinophaga niastensis]PSL47214.1 SusD-like starch-binding protein associating with outer membrane [Chitinophaga niastensis]
MKINRYNILLITFLLLNGCRLAETNVSPNASSDAPVSALLSGSEATLSFSLGVDAGLITSTYVQQTSGANGDATSNGNYTAGPVRFNAVWTNFYANALENLYLLQIKAGQQNLPYYKGISRILLTFGFGTLTDLFGDIPYTQALKQRGYTSLAYDKQEDIYKSLQLQLDTAISELSQVAADNQGALPAADDFIFNGDVRKWIATAWTLKARYAIHLSRLDGAKAAANVLADLYNNGTWRGIANGRQDAQLNFGSAATNANPYYQQNLTRPGWIGLGAPFVNLLNGNQVVDPPAQVAGAFVDPRRAYFATPSPAGTNSYSGSVGGVPGAFSLIGSYYGSATSPVVLISFSEAKFLEAEARIIINPADPLAQTALQDAIKASFDKVITNTDDPFATPAKQAAYITAKGSLTGAFATDLKTVITQKYIALFLQPESWTDYRRTGYPDIPLAQNATHGFNPNGNIPRRVPYPQSEQSLNKNTPAGSNYQTPRPWWDQ